MTRKLEHLRQQWIKQEVVDDALTELKRRDRVAKLKFFLVFIPLLFLAVAGMFYLAMIVPGFLMGV